MRAVVFDGPGRVGWPRSPIRACEAPGDAIVRVTPDGDLRLRPAFPPREGADRARRRDRARGGGRGGGGRRAGSGGSGRATASSPRSTSRAARAGSAHAARRRSARTSGTWAPGAFGGGLPGAQAEHVRVPVADVNLLEIPDEVDDERALFVGDVAHDGAVRGRRSHRSNPATTVAVVGVGSRRVLRDPGGPEPRGATRVRGRSGAGPARACRRRRRRAGRRRRGARGDGAGASERATGARTW